MKNILGIILIVVGVILFLFFKNYNGSLLPYPTLWFFVGIILVFLGIRLFASSKLKIVKESEKSHLSEIKRLKENGEKIFVELNDCEIVSSKYQMELPQSRNYRVQALDSLYDNNKSVDTVEINQSRIIYKNTDIDRVFTSPLIDKDKITLTFTLSKHKSTVIYVDRLDKDLYYFDLEFLEE